MPSRTLIGMITVDIHVLLKRNQCGSGLRPPMNPAERGMLL